jgi:hypothetical protein
MAFEASVLPSRTVTRAAPRETFVRSERLVVLTGASALGAAIGFAVAMTSGRVDLWVLALVALPALALAAHLTIQTLSEAFASRAWGCASASVLHVAALMAWPMTALVSAGSPALFWIAPGVALTALVLFASCWEGSARAVYRSGAQGALVAAIAAQQGVFVGSGA